jgi:hypothetical protein
MAKRKPARPATRQRTQSSTARRAGAQGRAKQITPAATKAKTGSRSARSTGRPAPSAGRRTPSSPSSSRRSASAGRSAVSAPKTRKTKRPATRARTVGAAASRGGKVRIPARRPVANRRGQNVEHESHLTPPSSLDLDRHPSAARSGRLEMAEALAEHTETGPALTGGDVDADWESAYSTGDEAPGGDMPTPDQDIVEEIGTALGVEYEDNEELKGANKIEQRDRHRWELDPASSEDYPDRTRRKG